MLGDGDHTRRAPNAPDYFGGWWGYSSKDLRTLLGQDVPAWRRAYCGRGSLSRCRKALRGSLRRALGVSREQLYGSGDCDSDPAPDCFDRNRSTVVSGIEIGSFPFQNRPTFQQTVSIPRGVP
jgi:hypothetical protein